MQAGGGDGQNRRSPMLIIDFRAASVSFYTQNNRMAHVTFEHALAIEIIDRPGAIHRALWH